MKFIKWLASILLVLIIVYFLGPQPSAPIYNKDLPAVPEEPVLLEKYIHDNEATHKLKPDNEARIVWMKGRRFIRVKERGWRFELRDSERWA